MKKKLPLRVPPVVGYLHHGFPLSTVWGNKNYMPWFYSNFIQLHSSPTSNQKVDFVHQGWWGYPFYHESMSSNTIMSMKPDIHKFIQHLLDSNYYLVIHLDEYYIPNRSCYHNTHFVHDTLIYGYNSKTRIYNICGFDEKEQFRETVLSFDDFDKSFYDVKSRQNIESFKFQEIDYDFNINLVIEWLKYYLLETNQVYLIYFGGNLDRRNFGIKIYDDLIKYIEIRDQTELDIRAFHVLWEHKKCMNLRIEYMKNTVKIDINSGITNELIEIENKAKIIRNLVLKYNVMFHEKNIDRVVILLREIQEKEYKTLKKLYKLLQKYSSS